MDWKLISFISEIDRFDANWTAIERKGFEQKLAEKVTKTESFFIDLSAG